MQITNDIFYTKINGISFVVEKWSTTVCLHYRQLLLDDNGTAEASEQVVMFVIEEGLKHLADASIWYTWMVIFHLFEGNFNNSM